MLPLLEEAKIPLKQITVNPKHAVAATAKLRAEVWQRQYARKCVATRYGSVAVTALVVWHGVAVVAVDVATRLVSVVVTVSLLDVVTLLCCHVARWPPTPS